MLDKKKLKMPINVLLAWPAAMLLSCAHVGTAEIPIEYIRSYDGDTITVNLPALRQLDKEKDYSLFWEKISVRLGGIDTPEIRGACTNEKELAQKARQFVDSKLKNARKITLGSMKKDKYFRILSEVYVDDISLAQMLIDEGYAIPYNGGTKQNIWCRQRSEKIK